MQVLHNTIAVLVFVRTGIYISSTTLSLYQYSQAKILVTSFVELLQSTHLVAAKLCIPSSNCFRMLYLKVPVLSEAAECGGKDQVPTVTGVRSVVPRPSQWKEVLAPSIPRESVSCVKQADLLWWVGAVLGF